MPVTDADIRQLLVCYIRGVETSGTRTDYTGRGNDFQQTGTVNAGSGHVESNCIAFSESLTDYLSLPSSDDFSIGDESFEILVWANWHYFTIGVADWLQRLVYKANEYRLYPQFTGSQNEWFFGINNGGGELSINLGSGSADPNAWYMMRAGYDKDNSRAFLAQNLSTALTASHTLGAQVTGSTVDFGGGATASFAGGRAPFNGLAGPLMLWKGRNLSADEVVYLYNGGLGRVVQTPIDQRLAFVPQDGTGTIYYFPLGWKVIEDRNIRSVPLTPLVRADGARGLTGYVQQKEVVVEGAFYDGPFDTSAIRPRIDDMREAIAGGPGDLYLYTDRKYRKMQAAENPDTYGPTGFNRLADSRITFRGPDPFQYAINPSTNTWTGPTDAATHDVVIGGGAYVLPSFAFLVGGSGPQTIHFTLYNAATDTEFVLSGAVVGGETVTVDCLDKTVLISTTDRIDLFDGLFFPLQVGTNTLTISISAGTLTSLVTTWRHRWW